MVVVALVLLGMVVLSGWFVLLALVGRSTFPKRERLPVRSWRFEDLRANAWRGITETNHFAGGPVHVDPR